MPRRALALVVLGLAFASCSDEPSSAAELKVTLLGTGTPTPRVSAFSASTLIEAGSEKILVDLGRGSTMRLYQKKIPLGSITAHFITHLHPDHLVGLPDMWLSGWLATPWGSRKKPMVIFGRVGTTAVTDKLTEAFSEDISIRLDDEHLPPAGVQFATTDVPPGTVYEKNGLKLSAIEVNHGEKIRPAFGYVVEFDGKKVVLSGDTKYDERVANAAKGADLLIHEVAVIAPELLEKYPAYRDIQAHHTSPEEAGRIFAIAKPKLAVYSHIVFSNVQQSAEIPEDLLMKRTRTTYQGPLVVGQDLMSFVIGDSVTALGQNGDPVLISNGRD